MDGKLKEINKIHMLRGNMTKLSELIAVGKSSKEWVMAHPVSSAAGMLLLGILTAVVAGSTIRLIFRLFSFALKIAAFVFVVKQALDNISNFFRKNKKQ